MLNSYFNILAFDISQYDFFIGALIIAFIAKVVNTIKEQFFSKEKNIEEEEDDNKSDVLKRNQSSKKTTKQQRSPEEAIASFLKNMGISVETDSEPDPIEEPKKSPTLIPSSNFVANKEAPLIKDKRKDAYTQYNADKSKPYLIKDSNSQTSEAISSPSSSKPFNIIQNIRIISSDANNLKTAILLKEILDKPKALQDSPYSLY